MTITPNYKFPKLLFDNLSEVLINPKIDKNGEKNNIQMANKGQGPFSFWRMIGVVRPRN